MNDAPPLPARRRLLGASAALIPAAAAAAPPTSPKYTVSRIRYGLAGDANLPSAGDTFVLPLAQVQASDGDAFATLEANNTIVIRKAGLYRVQLAPAWAAGAGTDVALRSAGLRLRPKGLPKLVAPPGGDLTPIDDTDEHLGTCDSPGSAVPTIARFPLPKQGAHDDPPPFPWTPGFIARGAVATIDIDMPVAGSVAVGDPVMAALSSISDEAIGAEAAGALIVRATAIAPDRVRVCVYNPTIAGGVHVPQGDLQAIAFAAHETRGGAAASATMLVSTTLRLAIGDAIYATVSSLCPGDFLPASDQLFVQIEKWKQVG